jgi:hypothetical protein
MYWLISKDKLPLERIVEEQVRQKKTLEEEGVKIEH